MNDQNQKNTNDLSNQTTGMNGGMFTAPPPIPPVNDTPVATNFTTDMNAPWADLMKDLPQDNVNKPEASNEVVEDNPFFRTPKVEETVAPVVMDAPTIPEAPTLPDLPVTPEVPVFSSTANASTQSVVASTSNLSTLPEIRPEVAVEVSKPEVVSDIPENFNPVVDQMPESIMQQAVPVAPVVTSPKVATPAATTPAATTPEVVTPSWMTETKPPVVDVLPITEPVKETLPEGTKPADGFSGISTNEVPAASNLPSTPAIENPIIKTLPEIGVPVAPIAPVVPEVVAMPEPVKPIDATITHGPAFAEPKVEVKGNPAVIPPAPAVVSATNDDEKDAKNHRVRDILLVLAVVILGVLALALGVALATSVIP